MTSGLPRRKKVLYYSLMLVLTLLAIEGMARLAYYAAYGHWYGGGPEGPVYLTPPPVSSILPRDTVKYHRLRHPFYGFANPSPKHALNAPLPRQRREDTVVIGLLGGSVAQRVAPFLQSALDHWFAANRLPRQPVVLRLAMGGERQPQQTLIVANTLLQGGEFDLIVNLDGFNELIGAGGWNPPAGVFPFFPNRWSNQVNLTGTELLLTGRIAVLRREQSRLAAIREASPLRGSALLGLANRWRQERIAAEIIQRNHELATRAAAYNLEKHGPQSWLNTEGERLQAAARFWYRGSAMLARLAAGAGADYYHFLQPNQYVPDSKPLSPEERERAYKPEEVRGSLAARGYPLLQEFNRDLQRQGINYFDLTGIFADRPETLYQDDCCHLNDRGNELLAAAMVRRMEPALRRLGGESPARPVSALAAARRPIKPDTLLVASYFQVYLQDNKRLRYVRENCAAADVESRFFLHLIARDEVGLPPPSREPGFDNRDFVFWEEGGHWRGRECAVSIPLPEYPIAALRTGQHIPDQGDLWSVTIATP